MAMPEHKPDLIIIALQSMLGRGAPTQYDDIGFNKMDHPFMDSILRFWEARGSITPKQAAAVVAKLYPKYRRQMGEIGITEAALKAALAAYPDTPRSAPVPSFSPQAPPTPIPPPAKRLSVIPVADPDKIKVDLHGYNAEAVVAIKSLDWRRFDGTDKCWVIEKRSAAALASLLQELGYPVAPLLELAQSVPQETAKPEDGGAPDTELVTRIAEKYPFLYTHQKIGVPWLMQRRGAILADSMGLGKTAQCILAMIEKQRDGPFLIICPASLKINWKREIATFAQDEDVEIISGGTFSGGRRWTIINYDILHRHIDRLCLARYTAVALDECFPYETPVLTRQGWLPIGLIVEEQLPVDVLSFDTYEGRWEWRPIVRWRRNPYRGTLIEVKHEHGRLTCTPNHAIWTDEEGYVEAQRLTRNHHLRLVPRGILPAQQPNPKILRQSLRSSVPDEQPVSPCNIENLRGEGCRAQSRQEEPGYGGAYAAAKSYGQSANRRENAPIHAGAHLPLQGRKRTTHRTAETTRDKARTAYGVPNPDEICQGQVRVSASLLQSGHCRPGDQDGHRSGWQHPQHQVVALPGPPEDRDTIRSRVVGTTLLEPESTPGTGPGGSRSAWVYNLEVSEHHNYVANGVLVSNCHAIKNQSRRTKMAMRLFGLDKKHPNPNAPATRYLLTGTPITSRPKDLLNLLIAVQHPLANSPFRYLQTYCDAQRNSFGKWDFSGCNWEKLPELVEKTRNVLLQRRKEDVLDLPDKTRRWLDVETNLGEYRKLEEEARQRLEEEGIYAVDETNFGRAYKATIDIMAKMRHAIAQSKVSATSSLAEECLEAEEKVVIFTCFDDTRRALLDHFGDAAVTIYGAVTGEKRMAAVDAFQKDPAIRVLVANLQAGGVGLNLTAGSQVIFNDLSWVPADHLQAEDRCYRIGTTRNVTVSYILASESIDDYVKGTVDRKLRIVGALEEGAKAEAESLSTALNGLLGKKERTR